MLQKKNQNISAGDVSGSMSSLSSAPAYCSPETLPFPDGCLPAETDEQEDHPYFIPSPAKISMRSPRPTKAVPVTAHGDDESITTNSVAHR